MAQEMDTLVCDNLLDVRAFPEVAPQPLKGRTWLLGKKYNLPQESKEFNADVYSKLWMTYRRNFRAIGGTTLTCDTGWGCTLRCGQMLLAQALVCRHLGRDWRWDRKRLNYKYMKILRKFLDIRDSEYSIQMIALQGADFGRPVGQWLGPNNVAQAIKKLSVHDMWSGMAVHVAMDMVVVVEDIKTLCQQPITLPGEVNVTTDRGDLYSEQDELEKRLRAISETPHSAHQQTVPRQRVKKSMSENFNPRSKTQPYVETNCQESVGVASRRPVHQTSLQESFLHVLSKERRDSSPLLQSSEFSFLDRPTYPIGRSKSECSEVSGECSSLPKNWKDDSGLVDVVTGVKEEASAAGVGSVGKDEFRPLLLFIPLRLGQDTFNMEYAASLKACLSLPQSVGFIGGRPRHAQYFIGYHDNYLWYLDPHTTQSTVVPNDAHTVPDSTYHCQRPDRMPINELDPSLALGFFCKDEADIDDLCIRLKQDVLSLKGGCYNMFELTEKRPSYWGPLETNSFFTSVREPFLLVNETDGIPECSDDEGFEIISWPVHTDPSHQ